MARSRRKKTKFFLGLILFMAIATSVAIMFISFASQPVYQGQNKTVVVEIPKGTGFLQIVEILDKGGLVINKPFFYVLALSRGAARHIRAGEYEFTYAMSPLSIIDKLVHGEIKAYLVTFPEDFTVREIAARLAANRLVDEKAFLALAGDKAFLASLGINDGTVEGYLYPETYKFDRSMSAKDIMRMMVQQFWKVVTPDLRQRATEMGMSLSQIITLASIIGKESGYGSEKALISAVFHNRLRKGMKLQSDPTAVYNLDGFNGIVLKKHLQRQHSHNTYVISGLPPGPIGNPAIDSIKAALYPANVDYLYFVSNNNGAHNFSSTLTAHHQAVSKYQIQKKKQ